MKNKYVQMIHEDSTQMSDLSCDCPTLPTWLTQGHGWEQQCDSAFSIREQNNSGKEVISNNAQVWALNIRCFTKNLNEH